MERSVLVRFRYSLSLLVLGLLTSCSDGIDGFRSEIGFEETYRITKGDQLIVPDGIVSSDAAREYMYGYGFKVEEWICEEDNRRSRYWLLPDEVFYILDTGTGSVVFPNDRSEFEAGLSQREINFDGDYSMFDMYRPITEYVRKWVKSPEDCEKRPISQANRLY